MTIGGIPRAHAHYEGDLTMGDYFLQKGRETDALLCVMHEGVAVESLSQPACCTFWWEDPQDAHCSSRRPQAPYSNVKTSEQDCYD